MSERHRARALLGVLAASLLAATAAVVLAAEGSAATGITITSGPCSGGGTSFCFNPELATTETGIAVTWTDASGVAHVIAQCTPGACPGSPSSTGTNTFDVAVPADGHGSFTFTSAGTYYYYCSIHGYAAMHGTITVTTSATPPPSPSATPRPTARPTARPTHAPVMQSASARPTSIPGATAPARITQPAPTTPSVTAAPAPSINGTAPTPTPSPHAAIALVSSGGNPALPIALVIAVLACLGVAASVSMRNRNR